MIEELTQRITAQIRPESIILFGSSARGLEAALTVKEFVNKLLG